VRHQAISVLDGNSFVVSDRHGDVCPDSRLPPHGFFAADTRFVSRWRLTVQGQPTDILSGAAVDYFAAQFFLTSSSEELHAAPALGIVRRRLLSDVWMEDVVVVNHRDERVPVVLDVEIATDFADLFEVKGDQIRRRDIVAETSERELALCYRNGGFVRETRVTVSEDAVVEQDGIHLNLWLEPREERRISFVIAPFFDQQDRSRTAPRRRGSFVEVRRERREELDAWVAAAPRLQTDDDTLRQVYRRSLTDLAALRFYPDIAVRDASLPAAGLPWFMTLFGRDSLITSYEALPFRPELARTTLTTLATRQGTTVDAFRDEEPGKVLHEIRFGELTATGLSPHSPYYGTADATPLFLVLLDEYERWTGDTALAKALEPAARAALEWIDRYGDLDGDGYVEYAARNPDSGLVNQCWKDSSNSILFADGRSAEGPVAACEIQGYVYDAKGRAARLAREAWDDPALAERLEAQAHALRERFLEDFWIPERGCFALALDGEKRKVDSLCSNMGHLLWSGIVDNARADTVAAQLMTAPLYSGWGVRTMASSEGGYNPVEYHNGTVWPHDNALIAAGLGRYGHRAAAARIAEAVVEAAAFFDYRLPEVFAGFDKELTYAPVEYPTASSPQAWAAAAPLLLLTTVLGLTAGPDGPRCDPHLPRRFGEVALYGLPGRWGRADVSAAPLSRSPP
jgi:glycogen debranching enzyme